MKGTHCLSNSVLAAALQVYNDTFSKYEREVIKEGGINEQMKAELNDAFERCIQFIDGGYNLRGTIEPTHTRLPNTREFFMHDDRRI